MSCGDWPLPSLLGVAFLGLAWASKRSLCNTRHSTLSCCPNAGTCQSVRSCCCQCWARAKSAGSQLLGPGLVVASTGQSPRLSITWVTRAGGRGNSDTHWILTAQHEANLPAGVGRDCAIGVLHHREQRLAELTHLLNEIQMQPLALAYAGKEGPQSSSSPPPALS